MTDTGRGMTPWGRTPGKDAARAITAHHGLPDATLAAWLAEIASDRTRGEYAQYVDRFLAHVPDPLQATPQHVHGFAYAPLERTGKPPSASTVTVRIAAVASLYDFLRRMGLVDRNPAQDVKRPKGEDLTPRGLSAAEIKRLLDATPDSPPGMRDRALIITFVLTGLRRRELLSMRRGDLTRNGAVYYSVRTKGGRQRRRELPPPAFAAIVEALDAQGRPLDTLADADPIFTVSHQGFYANLQRYARNAGLGPVRPHDLRHSAAKLRRDYGATLEEVSSFLGHRDLATTARYLARLEGETDNGWRGAADAIGVA